MFLPQRRRSLPARLVMIAAAAGLFVVGYQWGNRYRYGTEPPVIAGVLISPPIELTDFALQDPEGRPVTRDRFRDGWTLLTYGDLSQAQGHLAVNRLLEVRNRLADRPELRAHLRLVLVETTQAPNLARDFNRLDPSLVIADGEPPELAKLADALGGAPTPTPGDDAGSAIYVIAPGARLVALFTPGQGPATIAADLKILTEHPAAEGPPQPQGVATPAAPTAAAPSPDVR